MKGLTNKEVLSRQRIFGKNIIQVEKKFSALKLFLSQFPTFINGILFFAAVFSFFLKDFIDSSFIFAILLVNSLFGFFQEYKAEKSLEKLKNFSEEFSRVLRDGQEIEIKTSEVVPDDIVILEEGIRIPADGLIISTKSLEIDESVLTGESMPVVKLEKDSVFKGTLVVKGKGHLLVEKIGLATRFGEIAKTLSKIEQDKTPLQNRLDTLGKILSVIAITAAFWLIPAGLLRGHDFFFLILIAVTIGIAAIPESLPAIVTVALAIGTNRMAKRKAIVRKMQAVETLGSMQIALIDKTGTLTQNKMRVKNVWPARYALPAGQRLALSDRHSEAGGTKNNKKEDLLRACFLGNTSSLARKGDGDFDVIGDKTDGALLLWLKENFKNIEALKNSGEVIDEFAFDPDTKTITTVWADKGKKYAYVRGAPEKIISGSSLYPNEKANIRKVFEDYARDGLRVIAFGKKSITKNEYKREELEKELEFLGLIGIYDPPRPEAKRAVLEAKRAGITTIMVTGDNELTALSIAKEVGLIEKDEDVITGEKMDKMSDEELKKILLKTRVFARAKPEDKLRLVMLYKKLGYVVGVTGDGVNDALALKRADIGVSMGQEGTDVAKEASDIVLLDDNFSTLVKAVEEGRVIYNNILKAVTYLLSGNIAEISLVFFAVLFGLPSPLLPTQILWINLVTDSVPALALASDNKDGSLLKRKPRDLNAPILSRGRISFILSVGLGLSFILLFLFAFLLKTSSELHARTIVFNAMIFLHLLLAFAVRGKSIFKLNKLLLIGVLLIILLQVLITTHPFFQKIFHLGF